ncbi:MAG: hypothetical protein ACFB22_10605 [Rhodothalassiaceae bacterium]
MRALSLFLVLSLSPAGHAQEAEPEPTPQIRVTPPEEIGDPDTVLMQLPDGRVVSLADWIYQSFMTPGTELATDPLALDIQTGRIARLMAGQAVDEQGTLMIDPVMVAAQLGKRWEHLSLETIYASVGLMPDGSKPGPIWCEAGDSMICEGGLSAKVDEDLAPMIQPGAGRVGGLVPLGRALWQAVDGG